MTEHGWWGWPCEDPEPEIMRAMALGASQDPQELAMAARMLAAMPAQIIVEIGCDRGGTLYVWRQITARVYGITTADNTYDTGGSGKPLETHGAAVHIGDSHAFTSWQWLRTELAGDLIDGLVIDGDHTVGGVLLDVSDYGPMVRPGGVILLHDIRSAGDPRCEVPAAWAVLAARHETTRLANPQGGPGWGVIHVRDRETYQKPSAAQDSGPGMASAN